MSAKFRNFICGNNVYRVRERPLCSSMSVSASFLYSTGMAINSIASSLIVIRQLGEVNEVSIRSQNRSNALAFRTVKTANCTLQLKLYNLIDSRNLNSTRTENRTATTCHFTAETHTTITLRSECFCYELLERTMSCLELRETSLQLTLEN